MDYFYERKFYRKLEFREMDNVAHVGRMNSFLGRMIDDDQYGIDTCGLLENDNGKEEQRRAWEYSQITFLKFFLEV